MKKRRFFESWTCALLKVHCTIPFTPPTHSLVSTIVYMYISCIHAHHLHTPLCKCIPPVHSHVSFPSVHEYHLHTEMFHSPMYIDTTCTLPCIIPPVYMHTSCIHAMYDPPVYMSTTCPQTCIIPLCTCIPPAHCHASLHTTSALPCNHSPCVHAYHLHTVIHHSPVYMHTTCPPACITPLCTCIQPAYCHASFPYVHAHHLHTVMYHFPVYIHTSCIHAMYDPLFTCPPPVHQHVSHPCVHVHFLHTVMYYTPANQEKFLSKWFVWIPQN